MSGGILRIRAPHKVHVLSWVLALEKTGSVPCHFKNCKFMAISVEEMAHHYTYCKCEAVVLPHECDICHQRTDCPFKLMYHKIHCHSYNATSAELRNLTTFLSSNNKREITPTLRRAWQVFLENRRYLKCLQKTCLYVPDSIEEMENHYLFQCKEEFWKALILICETCNGRFFSEKKLNSHRRIAHNPLNERTRIVKPGVSEEVLMKEWANSIVNEKQAKCPVEQCKFVCNSISTLEKHYKFCTGEQKQCVTCTICNCWLQNEEKLIEHRKCIHKETEPVICKAEMLDDSFSTREPTNSVNMSEESVNLKEEEEARNHVEEYNVSNLMRHTYKNHHLEEIKILVKSEPPDYDETPTYCNNTTHYFEERDPLLPLDVKASSKKIEKSDYNENRALKARIIVPKECESSREQLNVGAFPHSSRTLQTSCFISAAIFQENEKSCLLRSPCRKTYNTTTNKPPEIIELPAERPDLVSRKNLDIRPVCHPVLEGNVPDILQHKQPWNSSVGDSEKPSLLEAAILIGNDTVKNNHSYSLSKEHHYKRCSRLPRNNSDKKLLKLMDVADECRSFGDLVTMKLRNIKSDEKREELKQKIQQAISSVCENID